MTAFIPKDIIILPESAKDCPNRWVLMNVFSQDCLGVGSDVLDFLGNIETLSIEDLRQKYEEKLFSVWEIGRFSLFDGLMADPTRYKRNVNEWSIEKKIHFDSLLELLKKNNILISDESAYKNRFKMKKNLLDGDHLGNFHQQVGQRLLLERRISPSKWWIEQKFSEDLQSVRNDNVYGAVQMHYLENYFPQKIKKGDVIVDMGCGIGLYAHMMARCGADVLGIDPNKEYIQYAQKNAVGKSRFEVMKIGNPGALDSIPDNYADIIYMSDALLFYFVPVTPKDTADIQVLFSDIHRILKPGGVFISLEPHGAFHLNPWLGSLERPFTIISEYLHKNYGVTPPISKLIQAYTRGGFAVTWMDELIPDPEFQKIDPRAYHFASEFPLWHIFELQKCK